MTPDVTACRYHEAARRFQDSLPFAAPVAWGKPAAVFRTAGNAAKGEDVMPKKDGVGTGVEELPGLPAEAPANGNGAQPGRETAKSAGEIKDDPAVQSCLRELETAVRNHPEEAVNWYVLGRFLLDIGDNRRAEAILRQALRRGPESATCRFFLGDALGNNGKFAEAAQQFRRLANIDPELDDPMSCVGVFARTHLGYCLGEMGRWQDAYITLLPATGIAVTIIRDLARFLANGGDHKRALFLNSVALLLTPGDADLLHSAASCHLKAGRVRHALDLLRKASKADPEDPDIWYDLGLTLARMEDRKKARPCFRRVLRLKKDHLWAWYDLACLDALEKKPAAAFHNLYKSIECGFKDVDHLLKDSDLRNIRRDPRWKVVIECISGRAARDENGKDALHAFSRETWRM